jgi:hypothetical protein
MIRGGPGGSTAGATRPDLARACRLMGEGAYDRLHADRSGLISPPHAQAAISIKRAHVRCTPSPSVPWMPRLPFQLLDLLLNEKTHQRFRFAASLDTHMARRDGQLFNIFVDD